MAQWGAGDPRWLVEHRDDGRNVNGWHWEEKSILSQVKARLVELLADVSVELNPSQQLQGELWVRCCRDITGDASISTRKGNKRLCVYDIKMTVEWEATLAHSEKKINGTMKVEEFGSASEPDGSDYTFEISTATNGADEEAAKRLMDTHGKPEVMRRLVSLAAELKDV